MTPLHATYHFVQARFGELWLKGRNRNQFIERLKRNVRGALKAEVGSVDISHVHGRLLVALSDPAQARRVIEILVDTPGLSSVQAVRKVALDQAEITAEAIALAQAEWGAGPGDFRVETKRPVKTVALRSEALNRHVGAALGEATGRPVKLRQPTHTLWIELRADYAWVWTVHLPGVAGLPVGSTGNVMLLLSGGLDSPVAGYLAQKRGCALDALYFHSPPFIGEASLDKVKQLAGKLAPRQGRMALHVVPFTAIQQAIRQHCPGRFTVLLYRRFMYRIADQLAEARGCLALCTGESLGQVASQTLENINAVDRLTTRLTLRPVITHDKTEIVEIARRIGTYDLSTLPFEDCCTLFVPDNPATRAPLHLLARAEAALDVDALVAEAIAGIQRVLIEGVGV